MARAKVDQLRAELRDADVRIQRAIRGIMD